MDAEIGYLPYIDEEPSQEHRDHVEQLIRDDLLNVDTTTPHAKIGQIVSYTPKYAGGIPSENGGIDLEKYIVERSSKRRCLETTFAHAYHQNRVLKFHNETGFSVNQLVAQNDLYEEYNLGLYREVQREQEKLDALNGYRREAQLREQPTFNYLNESWREGIRSCLELGVARLERGEAALEQQGE